MSLSFVRVKRKPRAGGSAILVVSAFLLLSSPAAAQTPTAGWQDGFVLQSANGDYRLQLGGVVQFDGRFTLGAAKPLFDTFSIRKARLVLAGRLAKYFDFRLTPDFGNGVANLLDAYFDVRFSPKFRIRAGKDKSPVGHEVLVADAALVFPERALPSSLLPNRDIGLQVQGDLAGGKVFYAAGVMNGIVDGTNSVLDLDSNSRKDAVGRIVVQPFRSATTSAPHSLSGLGFQVGGSHGSQTGALPTFRTSIGQPYFSYAAQVTANGMRTRLTPAVFYYYKAFGVFAEYAQSTQVISRAADTREITNQAWDVTAIINVTKEAASSTLVSPANAFDPPAHKWGALQAVVRYSELDVDQAVFDAGFAALGASQNAQQFTVGINWYPVQYIKYYVNYEHTIFDRNAPGARVPENALFFRFQVAY